MLGTIGRSLELFFIDGTPDGMQTAEVFNWTGHVLMAPRIRIKAALERAEARFTGIYVLLGDKDGQPFAYIGEAESIAERIKNHEQKKDWWTQAVLVTTGANVLNKAHVKYLESRLVEIALKVGRRDLENANTPTRPGLSEATRANMESFLDYLLMVLPALRVDLFQEHAKPVGATITAAVSGDSELVFVLVNKKHGLTARARLDGDYFTVLEGSSARQHWEGKGTWDTSYARLHAELRKTGVLVEESGLCRFAMGYAFASPSAAAAVVTGRPSNGTVEWKVESTGQTYKDWEAVQLENEETHI